MRRLGAGLVALNEVSRVVLGCFDLMTFHIGSRRNFLDDLAACLTLRCVPAHMLTGLEFLGHRVLPTSHAGNDLASHEFQQPRPEKL